MDNSPYAHLEQFQRQRHLLTACCERLLAVLVALESRALQGEVQRLQQRLLTDTLQVLVVGECNRGKSTVINALVGQRLLPAYPVRTTVLLSVVKWGEQPRATLHHHPSTDGSLKLPRAIALAELERYLVINGDEQTPDEYERVELLWPLPLCSYGIELIDSPALDDDERYLAATMRYLWSVDAVLFVLGCDSRPKREEILDIERIRLAGQEAIFFLCNRFDLVEPHAQASVKRRWLAHLRQFTRYGEPPVFFTNAKGALAGHLSGDREQLQHSNMPLVEDALYSFLARRGGERLQRSVSALQTVVHRAMYTYVEQQQGYGGLQEASRWLLALEDELRALDREIDELILSGTW
jgi:GTPase SAR1 family protein